MFRWDNPLPALETATPGLNSDQSGSTGSHTAHDVIFAAANGLRWGRIPEWLHPSVSNASLGTTSRQKHRPSVCHQMRHSSDRKSTPLTANTLRIHSFHWTVDISNLKHIHLWRTTAFRLKSTLERTLSRITIRLSGHWISLSLKTSDCLSVKGLTLEDCAVIVWKKNIFSYLISIRLLLLNWLLNLFRYLIDGSMDLISSSHTLLGYWLSELDVNL